MQHVGNSINELSSKVQSLQTQQSIQNQVYNKNTESLLKNHKPNNNAINNNN